jgi:hypothetical protein
MKRRTLLIAAMLSASLAGAQNPTWWRSLTPNQQQAIPCAIARDDQSLAKILHPLGWDTARFPDNDWSQRYVVVIAPNRFHRGYHLGFIEERKDTSALEFRWGWVTPEQSRAIPPANGVSIGGGQEGKEAIVVAFPRDEWTGRTATCSEVPLP